MMRKLLTAVFILLCTTTQGQDIQQFLDKLQDYSLQNPQEKVYLHTDKPSYSAGENIFFKSYTTIGITNLFSSLSGILYAELISPANNVVQRVTISTPMGIGIGDFTLSDTITEGVYRIRAYTNWMKNAGSDYFFDKKVPIYNGRTDNVITHTTYEKRTNDVLYKINLNSVTGLPISKKRISYTITEGDKVVEKKSQTSSENGSIEIPINNKYVNPILKLRFENIDKNIVNKIVKTIDPKKQPATTLFPEGGKLLKDKINTIAAKSINSQGLGISSKILLKQGSDTIGVFQTNELGMGAISVFLNSGAPLEAEAEYADGTKSVLQVPRIHETGFSILVNNLNDNKLFAQLNASADQLDNSDVYFVVHHLAEVLFVSKSKLNKEELVFTVEKSKLPDGVVTISILDSKFQPIIERPVFCLGQRNLNSRVLLNKSSYRTREKVEVNLDMGEGDDSLLMGAYSASVIDLGKVKFPERAEAHILSSLLLSNDLKGYIENPNYYFNQEGNVKSVDLDYLMLTQGWRNIEWESVGLEVLPKFKPEKSLKISGYTKKIGRSKPEPNAKVQLISTRNYLDFIDTTSNEEGYFEFDNLLFPDSVKFIISARDAVKGKNNIDITYEYDKEFPIDEKVGALESDWDINRQYLDNLKSSKEFFAELERMGLKEKAILIDEVVVTRKQSKAPDYSSNLNGPGNADQILGADDLSTCPTLEMCLAGRLMGVYFQNGVPYNTRGNQPMQIVLDGMYIESENISMINTADVESIEVLRNVNYTSIYGSNGANGLIVITSKRGSSALNNYVPKGILTVQPQGFQVIKNFYKPAYDVDEANKYNSDLRSTIHWEPAIVTNEQGKASFDFFTSDSKGKYLLIIEGIDLKGRLLRKEVELVVE
ncbi:TonB-dependent receptor plug domain-containing protein [Sphingobacterium sp. SGL-16]|uniref:TonB-dependent receptor plug domain-containing protein n=1 Tax=Sphingobacterium sp. SGL-16 TaxID=2710883 RepID=UPI0013EC6509|nr:TonB-dependent receptor plug domain-containing protein [Sphingobacterium sp. SGL-16]NGM74831.1 TonB-dependent receptor plug domain-containing protein [Sphingobacterium sp. SGL-16]